MRFFVVLCCLLISFNAVADMPSTERTRAQRDFVYGDTKIQLVFDSRKDPMAPDFTMTVHTKGRLVMQLSEVAFDHILSSPDHTLFVGLSNGGWPGSAVIVFDDRGQILLLARHGSAQFDYCATTSTFLREWYDYKDPQLKFPKYRPTSGEIPGITLKDCHGKTVDLLDTVRKANDKGYRSLRTEVAGHSFVPDK